MLVGSQLQAAGGDWRVAAMVTWCDVAWLATVRET